MIHFSRWKIFLIVAISVWGVLFAAPNFVSKQTRHSIEKNMPSWFPHKTINLGLDLQGGSHLLLEVDVDVVIEEQIESFFEEAKKDLRKARIRVKRKSVKETGFFVELQDESKEAEARKLLRKIDDRAVVNSKNGIVEAIFEEVALKKIRDQTVEQSIEIVRRRVDETGTSEPVIQRQGDQRIVLQLPGLDDPERVKSLLGKTAKLSFHLVDFNGGLDTINLPNKESDGGTIPVKRRNILTGDMLTNAQPSFQDGAPVVSFRLNGIGAKKFCEVTRKNSGNPFAIVLDGEVVSAPRINEPICGGAAIITGSFTVQETADMSLLLRAGALPAPLTIMEERTVGPSLGSDSVRAGAIAGSLALGFILVYMIASYGLFGMFAAFALTLNMALIFAVLSWLQATLTLPGIGGIILTIGMAVDANVLVFERIREEIRSGRSLVSAIDSGYKQAMSTIVDANMTTLIAALFLYSFGSGPVRGFAVTLTIGILTSLFSAIMLTRLIVATWLKKKKPKTLKI